MGPFKNMIHQEENEYMYIIHVQMILESFILFIYTFFWEGNPISSRAILPWGPLANTNRK